jgi:4-diphosphocytidyl-2-C-methyl-D-erythritol kinase
MLCRDREHAVDVATAVAASGDAGSTLVAASSPHGARLC